MNKWLFGAIASLIVFPAMGAHDSLEIEEIVVTAPFQRTEAETTLPVTVLSGDALKEEVGNTLGDTLENQIGVTSATFGTGVGLPVIRGQSGNRVQVMQNGVTALDAAAVSPDHSNGVEAIVADRIEVVRGPATLLYGNGAIGGVVNVIDKRIARRLPQATGFQFEQRHNTASQQNTSVFNLDSPVGDFAVHADGFYRESENLEIPGFAIDTGALDLDADELMELENTHGYIANSDVEAHGYAFGASRIFDRGYVGYSVSRINNEYGLPPGVHSHRHADEDEEEQEGEEHEEDVTVRLNMEQTRQDIRGRHMFDGNLLDVFDFIVTHNDYRHDEVEIATGEPPEIGTRFENKGYEGRFTLEHLPVGGWRGQLGLQLIDRTFRAQGEEAYIPRSEIDSTGVFLVESHETENWTTELGARVERQSIDPSSACAQATVSTSAGFSVMRATGFGNVLVSLQRSERSPTVEEYFSNIDGVTCTRPGSDEDLVLHAATQLYEVGDAGLESERANNVEFALRKTVGEISATFNLFYNKIDDYIYLDSGQGEVDGFEIAAYEQQDATFSGFEFEASRTLGTPELSGTLYADAVRARFDAGGNVPRIPPYRVGAELAYLSDAWSAKLRATRGGEQDDIGVHETPTPGYTRVDVYLDYHLGFGEREILLFLKGNNLLDEEVRNHTSFVKSFAPEPGRGAEIGIRLTI